MKCKIITLALLLSNFYCLHAMETTIIEKPIADETLQKLIGNINDTSFDIVTIVKQYAENNCMHINSHTLRPLLNLDQKKINHLFLQNIEDNELRQLLLSMGADINAQKSDKRNCLWFTKKPALLKELIARGATVDVLDDANQTRLYDLLYCLSPFYGADEDIKAAEILLKKGKADPNIVVSFGYTLLHKTMECEDPTTRLSAVALLCKYKMHINIKDRIGNTPLINAINLGDIDLLGLLLKHKADLNIPNSYGDYPLHIAFPEESSYYTSRKEKIIPAIVIALIEHGANLNIPYKGTKTMPLHVAVLRKQREIVKALIKHGAETHHTNKDGHTAWKLAQSDDIYNHLTKEVVDLLISKNETLEFTMTDFTDLNKTPKKETTSWLYKKLGY